MYRNLNKYNIFKVNLGIEILRMILCFWVISFHFSGIKLKIVRTTFHVPTFMFISFYFFYNLLKTQNLEKIRFRLERLLIPFIIIPIIELLITNLVNLTPNKKINIKYILNNLILQYITGFKILSHFWFIQILILLTILFEIIFLFFKKKSLIILRLLAIISYWLQYSEINYKIFINYKYSFKVFSRMVIMIPIAITGINLSSIKLLKILKNYYKKSIFFSIVSLYFICNYNIFGEFKSFRYSGIKQNITSICLFISFSLIPLDNINNIYILIFRQISKYTGGIYYFHTIIFKILNILTNSNCNSIYKCFITYIIGYLICFIGTKLFGRNKLKYLFN